MNPRVMEGVEVLAPVPPECAQILTPEAIQFLVRLHREFQPTRMSLLRRRSERQRAIVANVLPDYLPETREIRDADWQVASAPADLQDRRVEITGPVDRKMMINALNSGAKVFMADFEDALSPTWTNLLQGQANLINAVRRTLEYRTPDGKEYRLKDRSATLVVRPRGWHLPEKHLWVDGEPISGSFFDFGLYFFHNARELMDQGTAPYFYLPKLESHLEARLWNRVFLLAQDMLEIPRGTIRATVLIETILAAFEMEEILYELREHSAGLNAGRWDYLFSLIKKFHADPQRVLPERSRLTMKVPFMRAYTELLVKTCHRRGAHAIGGMAAFIPSRRDPEVNARALAKVREDKDREAGDGFDGTWVAHPDLVPVAGEIFDRTLSSRPHQKARLREEVKVSAKDLLDLRVPEGRITEAGVAANVGVAIQYIASWLEGSGAAGINNLMEDAATAEISRAQLWQWIHHRARLEDGNCVTEDLYRRVRGEALGKLGERFEKAADLLDRLVLSKEFTEFLTIPGYELLD